jgi:hypothetical protein
MTDNRGRPTRAVVPSTLSAFLTGAGSVYLISGSAWVTMIVAVLTIALAAILVVGPRRKQ